MTAPLVSLVLAIAGFLLLALSVITAGSALREREAKVARYAATITEQGGEIAMRDSKIAMQAAILREVEARLMKAGVR